MAKNDWYTINEDESKYTIQKIDKDDRSLADTFPNSYVIYKNASECSCFAGYKWCRHKQMLKRFQETNRLNSRWIHNFDRDQWLPPLTAEEV